MFDRVIKVILIIVGIFFSVIPICVFGLDWKLMADVLYRASFSIDEFNQPISYSSIYMSIIVINFIFLFLVLIANIGFIFYSIFNFGTTNLYSIYSLAVSFLIFSIPIESITYKFISCFSFYQASLVQARSTLMIVYALAMFGFSFSLFYNIRNKEKIIIGFFCIGFLVFLLAVITICALNIVLLINLSQTSKDINPETIKMGIFKPDEIELIKSGKFVKEPNFDQRIFGSINNVITSEDKTLHSVDCSDDNCSNYYKRLYRKEIECGQVSLNDVFVDCKLDNISKLIFKFQYVDTGGYPVYNCREFHENGMCKQNCKALENYGVYLIQEFSNKIELAWKDFGVCGLLQPKVDLKLDESIQVECNIFSKSLRLIQTPIKIFLYSLVHLLLKN